MPMVLQILNVKRQSSYIATVLQNWRRPAVQISTDHYTCQEKKLVEESQASEKRMC